VYNRTPPCPLVSGVSRYWGSKSLTEKRMGKPRSRVLHEENHPTFVHSGYFPFLVIVPGEVILNRANGVMRNPATSRERKLFRRRRFHQRTKPSRGQPESSSRCFPRHDFDRGESVRSEVESSHEASQISRPSVGRARNDNNRVGRARNDGRRAEFAGNERSRAMPRNG